LVGTASDGTIAASSVTAGDITGSGGLGYTPIGTINSKTGSSITLAASDIGAVATNTKAGLATLGLVQVPAAGALLVDGNGNLAGNNQILAALLAQAFSVLPVQPGQPGEYWLNNGVPTRVPGSFVPANATNPLQIFLHATIDTLPTSPGVAGSWWRSGGSLAQVPGVYVPASLVVQDINVALNYFAAFPNLASTYWANSGVINVVPPGGGSGGGGGGGCSACLPLTGGTLGGALAVNGTLTANSNLNVSGGTTLTGLTANQVFMVTQKTTTSSNQTLTPSSNNSQKFTTTANINVNLVGSFPDNFQFSIFNAKASTGYIQVYVGSDTSSPVGGYTLPNSNFTIVYDATANTWDPR
jgi:hypothetical protein